jgi:hypothetical protein
MLCWHTGSYAQNVPKPIDADIAIAAPHLPAVAKFDGSGTSFQYGNQFYKYDVSTIKEWIKTYPDEFPKYSIAMQALIKDTKASALPTGMQTIYYDLQAQYNMILKTTGVK